MWFRWWDKQVTTELERLDRRGRRQAGAKGVQVEGAVVVAHDLSRAAEWETLVVWPDRVEHFHHARGSRAVTEQRPAVSIDVARITAVECRPAGAVYGIVTVAGSGTVITHRTTRLQMELLYALLSRALPR